jgi:hypothetical protein
MFYRLPHMAMRAFSTQRFVSMTPALKAEGPNPRLALGG